MSIWCQPVLIPRSVTPAVTPGYSRLGYDVRRVQAAERQTGTRRRRVVHGVRKGGQRRGIAVPGDATARGGRPTGCPVRAGRGGCGAGPRGGVAPRDEALTKALTAAPTPSRTTLGASSTIAEFSAWWLRTVASERVRPSSLGKYDDRVERITAWLGDVRIGRLRAEQVATWQTELLSRLSAKTVADTRATLRSIVEEAVNLGLIATNPVDRCDHRRPGVGTASADGCGGSGGRRRRRGAIFRRRRRAAVRPGLAGVGGTRPRLVGPRPRRRRRRRLPGERVRGRRRDDARATQDGRREGPPP